MFLTDSEGKNSNIGIAPTAGSLVTFSSGTENEHYVTRVTQGH